jgi:plastocyanin
MKATLIALSWRMILLVAAAVGLTGLAGASPAFADDQPVKLTVKITDSGFEPNTLEVQSGQQVEVTFVWSHQAHPNEKHIIVFDGLKVETDMITKDNPQSTVKFVATTPGTFTFKCDIECDIHDSLQNGVLKVSAGPGSAAVSLEPSSISVEPSNVSVRGETVKVSAFLLDKDGQPIPKATVTFYAQKTFLGRSGLEEIGIAKTTATGLATLSYNPTIPDAQKLVARFEGGGIYDASEANIDVPANLLFGPAPAESHVSLHGLRSWAPVGFFGVIVAIWCAFAFMLYQAWGVRRIRAGR